MNIKNSAKKWAQAVVDLHNTPVPEFLQSKKNRLLKQAKFIKNSLEAADPLQPLAPVAQELGFIPVIWIAGAAALTAMSKWAKDAYVVKKDADKYESLVKSGVTPEAAQKLLSGSNFNWKMVAIPVGVMLIAGVGYKLFSRGR